MPENGELFLLHVNCKFKTQKEPAPADSFQLLGFTCRFRWDSLLLTKRRCRRVDE